MGIKFTSKIITYITIFSGIFFVTVTTSADTANIPNTFMAGQAAVAQEVNDNFTALKTAIDGNASKLPVLKDGDGIIQGTIITLAYATIMLMSENSYMFQINSSTGELVNQSLEYTEIDCGGVAYTRSIQRVLTDGDGNNYLYVPAGATPVAIDVLSIRLEGSGTCSNLGAARPSQVYPTSLNVPATTGVDNSPLALPLTIETL